ncbi:MAG TPA: hypothetical protein VE860_02105, partial [Chthoniobacterales bacterium]|nr:hypothetical protein [Chthoniobacterales bacterium]
MSLEINESISAARRKLLENFDDEVREKLKISDEASKFYLNRYCQFQRYLRIRADRAEINANVAMLFANGVCERDLPRDSSMPSDLVMICQWASLFMQSMDSWM